MGSRVRLALLANCAPCLEPGGGAREPVEVPPAMVSMGSEADIKKPPLPPPHVRDNFASGEPPAMPGSRGSVSVPFRCFKFMGSVGAVAAPTEAKEEAKEEEGKEVAVGEATKAASPDDSDRMRQALLALRQRRIDLDNAQAEIEVARGEAQHLQEQLRLAKQELDSEREAQVSETVVYQSQISSTKVELEAVQRAKATLASEAEASRVQLRASRAELAEAEKAKASCEQDVKAARGELAAVKAQLEEAARERTEAVAEAEAQKAQASAAKAELDDARKGKAAAAEEAKAERETAQAQRTELREAQMALLEAQKAKAALLHQVDMLRSQLTAARTQVEEAQGRIEFLEEHGGEGGPLSVAARVELEASWEALVCTGLEQLRTALSTAGVRTRALTGLHPAAGLPPSASTTPPSSSSGSGGGSSGSRGKRPASVFDDDELPKSGGGGASGAADARKPPKRKGSRDLAISVEDVPVPRSERRDQRNDKKDKKDKKKKDKKETKKEAKKVDSDRSEEDIDLGDHTIIRSSAPSAAAAPARVAAKDSETESQESDGDVRGSGKRKTAPLHRNGDIAPSALKRRRAGRVPPRISFADAAAGGGKPLISAVTVASYRDLSDLLWFTNPQANVLCERCKRRVPQKMGQLRGGNGGSSFMCDIFYCTDCAHDEA
mmetsp:Transcript_74839/g.243039  ORF Transcript_74839/g.243039 Transcript_74839/m.243039 type:complete len:666 (-) Transcript_74839:41-2038(-)